MTPPEAHSWVELSRSNLIHNVRVTRESIPKKTKLFAVVKANAYGHGKTEVAKSIASIVDGFCVAGTTEALELRQLIPKKRILAISYFTTLSKSHLAKLSKKGIEVPVYSLDDLKSILQTNIPLEIQLKFDTGTSRIGFKESDLGALIKLLNSHHKLTIKGIYSHFADAEDFESTFSDEQLQLFSQMTHTVLRAMNHAQNNVLRHIACSAAISRNRLTHLDAVRLGIHLYGLSGITSTRKKPRLREVMTWKTKIIQVKELSPGSTIGYNRTYKTSRKTRLAILPVGYADGLSRLLSNVGTVLVEGKLAPVRGNICMNVTMVDVTHIPRAMVGSEVILLGPQHARVTANLHAKITNTINYEVVTRINSQLPRIVTK